MGIRGRARFGVAAIGVIAALALAGCAPGGSEEAASPSPSPSSAAPSAAAPSTPPSASAPPSETPPSPEPPAAAVPDTVAGTYRNDDWVIRLAADGTWEEDFGGQANAYGGTYTVDGDRIVLQDRGGSSETATLQGDELHLPSVTLRRG